MNLPPTLHIQSADILNFEKLQASWYCTHVNFKDANLKFHCAAQNSERKLKCEEAYRVIASPVAGVEWVSLPHSLMMRMLLPEISEDVVQGEAQAEQAWQQRQHLEKGENVKKNRRCHLATKAWAVVEVAGGDKRIIKSEYYNQASRNWSKHSCRR